MDISAAGEATRQFRGDSHARSGFVPKADFGPIASGEKVIADQGTIDQLVSEVPKMVGVAMEGAGVVADSLVDQNRIGIIGFSRTCYHVLEALTSSTLHFTAASITDGVIAGYLQYITGVDLGGNGLVHDYDAILGAAPFREGLQLWLKRSPGFNMDKVTAPLQVVANGRLGLLEMWEPYAALRLLQKPVDLILIRSGQVNLVSIFTVTVRTSIMTALLTIGFLGVLFSQSNRKAAPEPKFTELSREDSARLEQQRAVVLAAAKQRYGTLALTRTKSDLPVLQNLIDDRVFNQSQTYQLQSLGVAFGDVLAALKAIGVGLE